MYHDGQRGGAVTKGGKETGNRRGMWQRNRLFPPRGPIVIYAPENDPLPTWNIKNHARTWKFRKKNDDDGSDGNGSGNGDSEKDLAQFCTSPPETQRSQSRRWPCRSVSGGRSQLQFSCQLNLWRKRREEQRKRSNNLLCRSFWFTTTVSALLPLPLTFHSSPSLCCRLSQVSCSVRDKVNSGQLRVARVKPRRVIYDSAHVSRNPPPPSVHLHCPCSTPLPFEWLAC